MKIKLHFYSLKDLSDLSNIKTLLEIFDKYNLIIEKADNKEPIKKEFSISNLSDFWKGVGLEGQQSECYFLFRGKKEIAFKGMIIWNINLHPNNNAFNGVYLWINIPKGYNINKLIQLGDELFTWSEAVYGYIADVNKEVSCNSYDGIKELMWINYFGKDYVSNPDFHIPNGHVSISHGIKIQLTEMPNDDKLNNTDFLQNIKDQIGAEWFISQPRKIKIKIPNFDKSAITRS